MKAIVFYVSQDGSLYDHEFEYEEDARTFLDETIEDRPAKLVLVDGPLPLDIDITIEDRT